MAILPVIGIVLYAKWLDKKYPDFNQQAFTQEELNKNLMITSKAVRRKIYQL